MIINPVNVADPQSLRHVQLICKFTANDTRENLAAALFHEGSLCKKNLENLLHWRVVLLQLQVTGQVQVLLVKNTNGWDLRQKPQSLTGNNDICQYTPVLPVILSTSDTSMDDVVANVDVTAVATILVMHNTITAEIDKATFVGSNDAS